MFLSSKRRGAKRGSYGREHLLALFHGRSVLPRALYKLIIVSGRNSAPNMRDFLVFNGVPAERIGVEDQATNTHENAAFTARMLAGQNGKIILLTSDSHMLRARRCFAREGVSILASAVPDVIKRAGTYAARSELFIGEIGDTGSFFYYWYRGWL